MVNSIQPYAILEAYFIKPIKAFFLRLQSKPFDTIAELGEFLQTRSSYVAQTALYGYLKTRMGTKFRSLFEDELFGKTIQSAAANLFGTCLADLTLYTVARLVRDGGLAKADANKIAAQLYRTHLKIGLAEIDDPAIAKDAQMRFNGRLKALKWDEAIDIYHCFAPSEADIIRFAPVSDNFKEQDKVIVGNSVRLRWNDIRAQLVKRLRPVKIVRQL